MHKEANLRVLLFTIVMVILLSGIFMALITRPDNVKYVLDRDNDCHIESKEETGKRLYCGKACTTPEFRHVFSCPSKGKIIVDWYEIK